MTVADQAREDYGDEINVAGTWVGSKWYDEITFYSDGTGMYTTSGEMFTEEFTWYLTSVHDRPAIQMAQVAYYVEIDGDTLSLTSTALEGITDTEEVQMAASEDPDMAWMLDVAYATFGRQGTSAEREALAIREQRIAEEETQAAVEEQEQIDAYLAGDCEQNRERLFSAWWDVHENIEDWPSFLPVGTTAEETDAKLNESPEISHTAIFGYLFDGFVMTDVDLFKEGMVGNNVPSSTCCPVGGTVAISRWDETREWKNWDEPVFTCSIHGDLIDE